MHQSPKLERPRSLSLHTVDDPPPPVQKEDKHNNQTVEAPPIAEVDDHDVHDIAHLNLIDKHTEPSMTRVKISERENNIIPAEIPAEYTPRTPSNLTEQGFLDLKFYHSRLW